jgi:CRP/FNR family transcriptional regulator, cyclic AMP receptor protein
MSEKLSEPALLRLDGVEIFQSVAPDVMEHLTQRAQRRTRQRGELLLNLGDPSDALYVVARTAGASAMAPTELIGISRKTFFNALDQDRQLVHNVIALLCRRLDRRGPRPPAQGRADRLQT